MDMKNRTRLFNNLKVNKKPLKTLFNKIILIIFAMKDQSKTKVEFIPLLLTEKTDIYTIRLNEEKDTEFNKFLIMFKDSEDEYLKGDLDRIIRAIEKISENGALESYFRNEGLFKDRVCAIPLLIEPRDKTKHGTLRLYCIRVSDSLLIVGGGGLKVTDKYEADENLESKVKTLQAIDNELMKLERQKTELIDEIVNISVQID